MREKGSRPEIWPERPIHSAEGPCSRRTCTSPFSMMVISVAGSPSRKMVVPASAKRSTPCVASHSYSASSIPCRAETRLSAAIISGTGVGDLGVKRSSGGAMLAIFIGPFPAGQKTSLQMVNLRRFRTAEASRKCQTALICMWTLHFYLPFGHGIDELVELRNRDRLRALQFDAAILSQQIDRKPAFRDLKAGTDGRHLFAVQNLIGRIQRRLVPLRLGDDRQEQNKTVHHVISCAVQSRLLLQQAWVLRSWTEDQQWPVAMPHLYQRRRAHGTAQAGLGKQPGRQTQYGGDEGEAQRHT